MALEGLQAVTRHLRDTVPLSLSLSSLSPSRVGISAPPDAATWPAWYDEHTGLAWYEGRGTHHSLVPCLVTALPWLVANLIDAATLSLLTNLVRKSDGFSVSRTWPISTAPCFTRCRKATTR